MYGKLAAAGLVAERASATLGAFLDGYIDSHKVDAKSSTHLVYGHTRRCLLAHFGADKILRDITPGDADAFRLFLAGQGLADNTVRRRIGIARQFFNAAKRRKFIPENPFDGIAASVRANMERFRFVTRQEAQQVLAACPNAEWRLLFALSRFGGLRCPSEHLALRWQDVDWARNRIRISSPKTAHHEGGASRVIPLFPELLPPLREVFEATEPGAEFVISRYRSAACNLRTQLERIIRKAGLQPWPKLFQNLRSTRETELAETFPMRVVCRRIGNSQPVAAKHYLQLTEEHFDRAIAGTEPSGEGEAGEAAQKAAQRSAAEACNQQNPVGGPDAESAENPQDCSNLHEKAVACTTASQGGYGRFRTRT